MIFGAEVADRSCLIWMIISMKRRTIRKEESFIKPFRRESTSTMIHFLKWCGFSISVLP